MKNHKKTILIDLDGVLNEYAGNFDKFEIPPIKKGATEFIKKLSNDFELRLFTTRNKLLAARWLSENNLDKYFADITNIKELSWLIIDDRCLKFKGNYDILYNEINNFQTWWAG